MNLSVLIPTYRRVDDLRRCLKALHAQERLADEIVVTVRDTDVETQTFLSGEAKSGVIGTLPLRQVLVYEPGVVAAMNAGVLAAQGDIIALTDDDTAPHVDWLKRIEAHFMADEKIGGVGGRDWQKLERGEQLIVGKVQWFGRVIGNHHLGAGAARAVDVLKGANCAYRAAPIKDIGFDTRLLGGGAQVNWELGLGLAMRRAGWTLIYDPAVAVEHYIGERFEGDLFHRGIFDADLYANGIYNETLFLWEDFSMPRRLAFVVWAFLVGTKASPGLLQTVRLLLRRDAFALARFRATCRGRIAAMRGVLLHESGTSGPPAVPPIGTNLTGKEGTTQGMTP